MAGRRTPISEQKTVIHTQPPRVRGSRPKVRGSQPPPIHIPARRSEKPANERRAWPLIVLLLFLAFACGALALVGTAWAGQQNKILPGVQTLGIPLGGQTIEDASRRLEANWNARRVVLQDGQQASFTMPLTELGILLDARATARAAYRQGRNLSLPQQTVQALFDEATVQPIWYLDPAVTRSSLENLADGVNVPPGDPGIELVGARVQTTPGTPGRRLNVEETLRFVQQNAVQISFGQNVPLVVEIEEPQATGLEPLVADLNRRLSAPVLLHTFDPIHGESQTTEIAPETWSTWISLETTSGAGRERIGWQVDPAKVEAFLQSYNATLGDGRYLQVEGTTAALTDAVEQETYVAKLRIYRHPRQHVVQSGETLSSIAYDVGIPYPWIQQANPALGDRLSVGQSITIPSPDELIPLPVIENKRIVVSLEQQQMWVYENGELKWQWVVSTGIDSSPTAPGVFQIQSHEPNAYASIWDLWMPQFMGIYRPVPTSEFMNGFHGFPTRDGANLLWTNSLGRRVTYGCILVSNENIALLYDWADAGVIVEVRP